MKAGIIGLPSSGKTTVFNAISGGSAEVHAFASTGHAAPNLAVVPVPDSRLDWLSALYKPKKTTNATVELVDVAGVLPGQAKKDAFSDDLIANLRQVDALVHVVRDFQEDSLPHPSGSIDPTRDADTLEQELVIADLIVVEKRLSKLDAEIQKKKGTEKTMAEGEKDLLTRFHSCLSEGKPLRGETISEEEQKLIRGYTFLSAKPLLVVANINESGIAEAERQAKKNGKDAGIMPELVKFCAKAEMEIAQMNKEEQGDFL